MITAMNRVYNFSAGPSMLPLSVLERAASELICYGDSGMSVMEMSHRSPDYEEIIKTAEADLREIMSIPDNYKVLFLQGGASTQFASVAYNLLTGSGKADYGVIYAGAQKNMAPAGLTVVIVREDLLGHCRPDTPAMFDWKLMADNGSMYNTPPCYPIYVAGLVYKWIKNDIGGLEEMKRINEGKANLLYDYLDTQSYYIAPVEPEARSMMNVTFVTGDPELDKKFAAEAGKAGFKNIKGHRSVGGMRASIYNAMPTEGVAKLVQFMKNFAAENPKA